jgi:flagellar protein FliS
VAAYAAPKSYQQNAVLTATPGKLVVMLYDGATRFLRQAAAAMRAGEVLRSHTPLDRAQAIVNELLVTLDHERGGEIASSLRSLYLFINREIVDARVQRDPEKLDTVIELLSELRDAWAQIESTGSGAE